MIESRYEIFTFLGMDLGLLCQTFDYNLNSDGINLNIVYKLAQTVKGLTSVVISGFYQRSILSFTYAV